MLVKISDIKVKKRVRQDLGDLEGLKDSLRTYGLLNPITLSSKYELIAGERRLEAAKAIGWESINAVVLGRTINAVDKLEMELEENNQRKEFTEEELLEGYHRLEKLRNPSIFMRIWNFICKICRAIADFIVKLFSKKKAPQTKKASAPESRRQTPAAQSSAQPPQSTPPGQQ